MALSVPAAASEQTFTTIDFPGADATQAIGINSPGDIVGRYVVGGISHGYLLRDGEFTVIDFPDATFTEAGAINNRGDIVGSYRLGGTTLCSVSADPPCRGFLLRRETFSRVDVPGSVGTLALGIGVRGEIVGSSTPDHVVADGYLFRRGEFTTIDFPGSSVQVAAGINRRGEIVGWYVDAGGSIHGYLLRRGEFTTIDVPGATFTRADGINRRGEIVGSYRTVGTTECTATALDCHGFVLRRGEFTSIDVPDAKLTVGRGINDRGDIVGRYFSSDGSQHGFLLSREDEDDDGEDSEQ